MGKLTALKVKNLRRPGRYSDGGGLLLKVNETGGKSWILRIQINKRRHDYGLGSVSVLGLAEARHAAYEARRAIHLKGRNPFTEREAPKSPTFSECAERTYDLLSARWRSPKSGANWRARIEKYALPRIGDSRVDEITREDMLAIIGEIWAAKPEMGRKLRQALSAVFKYAMSCGHVRENLAGEVLSGALIPQPKVRANFRALPYGELPEAMKIVEASGASMSARSCFAFLVHTAARSGEARMATWDEIDLKNRV